MSQERILYVCSECAENNEESCGRFDRRELRVMPDGKWLCEDCFDETNLVWGDLPAVPEYGPVAQQVPDREQIAALLYVTRFPKKIWLAASGDETAIAYEQADAILSLYTTPGAASDTQTTGRSK